MATLNRNLHRRQQSCRMVPPALFLYTLRETRARDAAALLELILRARRERLSSSMGRRKREHARARFACSHALGMGCGGRKV